jgi:hypothetical protein
MKSNLTAATCEDAKILMSNDTSMSISDLIELYGLRWQIEVFQADCPSSSRLYQPAAGG